MLHGVDRSIADDDPLCEFGVMGCERLQRITDRHFGEAPHPDDDLLDGSKLAIKRVTRALLRRRPARFV
jgi:hypothetical protein